MQSQVQDFILFPDLRPFTIVWINFYLRSIASNIEVTIRLGVHIIIKVITQKVLHFHIFEVQFLVLQRIK